MNLKVGIVVTLVVTLFLGVCGFLFSIERPRNEWGTGFKLVRNWEGHKTGETIYQNRFLIQVGEAKPPEWALNLQVNPPPEEIPTPTIRRPSPSPITKPTVQPTISTVPVQPGDQQGQAPIPSTSPTITPMSLDWLTSIMVLVIAAATIFGGWEAFTHLAKGQTGWVKAIPKPFWGFVINGLLLVGVFTAFGIFVRGSLPEIWPLLVRQVDRYIDWVIPVGLGLSTIMTIVEQITGVFRNPGGGTQPPSP